MQNFHQADCPVNTQKAGPWFAWFSESWIPRALDRAKNLVFRDLGKGPDPHGDTGLGRRSASKKGLKETNRKENSRRLSSSGLMTPGAVRVEVSCNWHENLSPKDGWVTRKLVTWGGCESLLGMVS